MKKVIVLLICCACLVACKPSAEDIEYAMYQTQKAAPTETKEPTATNTISPTLTPTQTPTTEPTATATVTATPDLRVITIDSKELMLTQKDLPAEGKYYIPNADWISPHHNYEILRDWGEKEGKIYLEETGRIDGWFVYYLRGTDRAKTPLRIYQNIIQYKTSEGAYLTLTKYDTAKDNPDNKIVESDIVIGDYTIIYESKIMQDNGEYLTQYYIESAYRNYISNVAGLGWDYEITLEDVVEIANIAMEKIKAAPLGNW